MSVGRITFAEHSMVLTAAAINIGFEAMLFWVFARVIATQRGLLPRDARFEKLRQSMPLERGLALGAVLIVLGLVAFGAALSAWSNVGFGQLQTGIAIRLVIASSTTLVFGTQIIYGSFLLYVLDYRGNRSVRPP
jgi:hypothetical protein